MARIKRSAGDEIEAMAPTTETSGMLKFRFGGQSITRQVQIIGIRPEERAKTGDFAEFLTDGKRQKVPPSFEMPERVKRARPPGPVEGTGNR